MSEQPSENPLILTTDEAAVQVGVSPVTIRRWVMKGWLTPLRRGAKPLRFHLLDVTRCHVDHQPRSWHDALDRAWQRVLDIESGVRER